MNINTRFAVGVHILALLSLLERAQCTSDLLARSVNTNAVVIRRLIGRLKEAGLVEAHPGIVGSALARPAGEITLLDVSRAVLPPSGSGLFRLHPAPNARCPVGRTIHEALALPLEQAERAMRESLETTTVGDIAAFIRTSARNA